MGERQAGEGRRLPVFMFRGAVSRGPHLQLKHRAKRKPESRYPQRFAKRPDLLFRGATYSPSAPSPARSRSHDNGVSSRSASCASVAPTVACLPLIDFYRAAAPPPNQIAVYISRVLGSASVGGPFAELEAVRSDSVAKLAKRACAEFPLWSVDASQVELFLAAADGNDEPTADAVTAALSGSRLQAGWSLEHARIGPGSWLLARIPPLPAAAPGAFDIVTAFAQLKTELLSEIAAVRTPKGMSMLCCAFRGRL